MNRRGNKVYEVKYHYLVVKKDILKLSGDGRAIIKKQIEVKLTTRPEVFGKPLRQSLKGYRKLRVGDYRIIFKIVGRVVFILLIEHRSVVYQEVFKRISIERGIQTKSV